MKLNIILIAILLSSTLYAGSISDQIVKSDNNLSQIKDMIDEEQEQINKLKNEKIKAAKELKKAELKLRYQKSLSKKLKTNLRKLKKDIAYIKFQITKQTARQKELEENIRSANFYLAGAGETELLEALILGDELTELTAGLQIISKVNNKLFDMVKELDGNKRKLNATIAKLNEKQNEIKASVQERDKVVKEYESNKILVKQLYKIAEEDEQIKKEFISMLESKQNELEKKIQELEIVQIKQGEERKFDGLYKDFGHMAKKLEWPINGKIIEHFGTKKIKGFRGVVHKKGIKIQPAESHVSSVYDGVVMHTDTAWGLGWFVIIEHAGGYYSLYANMDEITVKNNQKVHSGEILGTIDVDHEANTPYLYFEIRIHDKAVDPEKWLS